MKNSLYLKLILQTFKNFPQLRVIYNFFKFQLNKFLKSSNLNYYPISIIISATKRCNFSCSFCFVEDYMSNSNALSGDLTPKEFESIRNSQHYKHALRVGFLGGEPFLNKNIFEYLEILDNDKKISTIVTNSSLLKGALLDKLLNSPLGVLGLSLYDNNIDDVKRVASSLSGKKLYWIQTIIPANNLSKIEDTIKLCINIGCTHLILDNYYPNNVDEEVYVIKSSNQEYQRLKNTLSLKYQGKINITWVAVVPKNNTTQAKNCQLPMSYIQLDNEGNIGPCCVRAPDKKFGNIYEEPGWNSQYLINLRKNMYNKETRPMKGCENCQCLYADLYNV